MLPLAALCGITIIALGFATGTSEVPPLQALTLGGMFLIAVAFGKLWRLHGIGAATVVALLTVLSLGPSVWTTLRTFLSAEAISTPLIGLCSGFAIGLFYLVVGFRFLIKELRSRNTKPSAA